MMLPAQWKSLSIEKKYEKMIDSRLDKEYILKDSLNYKSVKHLSKIDKKIYKVKTERLKLEHALREIRKHKNLMSKWCIDVGAVESCVPIHKKWRCGAKHICLSCTRSPPPNLDVFIKQLYIILFFIAKKSNGDFPLQDSEEVYKLPPSEFKTLIIQLFQPNKYGNFITSDLLETYYASLRLMKYRQIYFFFQNVLGQELMNAICYLADF